jgi:aldehyde:ferredoxin oxidoreductase
MLDTITSSTGTLQTGPPVHPAEFGMPARINPFDPGAVAKNVGGHLGRRHFEDSLGACIFTTRSLPATLCRALSAATGWEFTKAEGVRQGRRTAALFRAFDLRCGIGPDLEWPSARYGSIPVDGPAKGRAVQPNWERMVDVWYETVGYDRKTGRPQPDTLRTLGLEFLIPPLWGT